MFSQLITYIRNILLTPATWIATAGRWMRVSLPVRVMIILFIFVLIMEISYIVVRSINEPEETLWGLFPPFFVIVIVLPISAYYATRFWLETPPSDTPDIDEAWNLGLEALAKAGIEIDDIPLYLTMGVADAQTADYLMQASGWNLKIDGEPTGSRPLRWYASEHAAMLFLLDASATSAMHHAVEQPTEESYSDNLRGTIVGGAAFPASGGDRGIRGTMVAGAQTQPPAKTPSRRSNIRGTILAGSEAFVTDEPVTVVRQLDRKERIAHSQRLARVCELALGTRLPHCPFNGLLTVVDWNTVLASRDTQLAASIRSDYDAVMEAGKISVPMVVLVSGLEVDAGFVELTRRVGEDRIKNNRFGHSFNHLISPTAEQLETLAMQASGAFEDQIYDLFRQPECLDRRNNEKLFGLLCRTRNELYPRLKEMLAGLAKSSSTQRTLMLAGCYFGAAGRGTTKQAFVKNVIEKLVDLEDDIEWSEEAVAAEDRLIGLLKIIAFLNAFLIIFILGVVAYRVFYVT